MSDKFLCFVGGDIGERERERERERENVMLETKKKKKKTMVGLSFLRQLDVLFFHMSLIYLKMGENWRYSNWR